MNELNLKTIWNKTETSPLQNVNFEWIKQNARDSQKILQNKIKWDVAISASIFIALIPIIIYDSKAVFLIPFFVVCWILYIRGIVKLYMFDSNFEKFDSVKSFLAGKEKILTDWLKQSRWATIVGIPILHSIFPLFDDSYQFLWNSPVKFVIVAAISIAVSLLIIEIYFKKMYAPVLDELQYLLQQLNDK